MDATPTRPPIVAGALAGLAGFAVFLVLHHLWIVPIWFIAPVGGVVAAVGGVAVGAAYAAVRPRLPARPWTVVAVVAVFAGMLLPAALLAQLRSPIFAMDPDGGASLLVGTDEALRRVLVGFVGLSAATGALVGTLLGRSWRSGATMAVAATALALGPGHNIPLLGGTVAAGTEVVILGAVFVVAAAVLVETDLALSRPGRAA